MAQREWWQLEAARTDLLIALDHFNAALTSVEQRPGWQVDACTDVFWGLNKLWELREEHLGPYATDGGRRATDLRQFKELARGVSVEWADWLLRCDELQRLAQFRPMILDHAAAGMSQSPLVELPDSVIERASRAHAEFDRKLDSYREGRARSSDGALAELAYLLSIVRNNLMHGEKTRSGPDPERTRRNHEVADVVFAAAWQLVDAILDRPSRKLVAYGTLRPGQANHALVDMNGEWSEVSMRGEVSAFDGLPSFVSDPRRDSISARLLISDDLPSRWSDVDRVEGSRYKRVLVRFEGNLDGVGYTYESAQTR